MADASKLKSKRSGHQGGLGNPPGPDEVATSLNSPELAPVENPSLAANEQRSVSIHKMQDEVTSHYVRRDGRSARKTNRTLAFATRVTPEFDCEIRDIAEREGIKLVEVLEKAIAAYRERQGY
jgi:hypothetical protein